MPPMPTNSPMTRGAAAVRLALRTVAPWLAAAAFGGGGGKLAGAAQPISGTVSAPSVDRHKPCWRKSLREAI